MVVVIHYHRIVSTYNLTNKEFLVILNNSSLNIYSIVKSGDYVYIKIKEVRLHEKR